MFEQTFKNLDDVLRKEAGCSSELDYTEQTSWLLFLKYLDDLEETRAQTAELVGTGYEPLLDDAHRWSSWAAPKLPDGSADHDRALTGPDLIDFVNEDLFPYLKSFRGTASSSDTIEYKIGEILVRSAISSPPAIRCGTRSISSMASTSRASRKSTSSRTSTKAASKIWGMPGATAANTTLLAH